MPTYRGEAAAQSGCARIGARDTPVTRPNPSDSDGARTMTTRKLYTAEDLWALPGDEPWELWDGALHKVPGAGGLASSLAGWIGMLVSQFVRPRRFGLATGPNGGYVLARDPDTVLLPDVAYTRWDRLPPDRDKTWFETVSPDLVVEVIGWTPWPRPSFDAKMEPYRRAGVPLVWRVESEAWTVAVYRDGRLEANLTDGDELDGGEILPGFRLPVAEIFAEA